VLFILILSVSAAAQTAYDQYMSQGTASLEKKDYDAAEEAFRAALREKPDDNKATLYLGIALNKKGAKEAESLLKKSLLMNPADPMTNLQLGLYYFNRSIYPEAMDYFETTIELAPGSEYSSEASRYLKGPAPAGSQRGLLDIALGMQYDSNVILGPGNQPLPEGISRKSDWRGVVYLRGQYDIVSTQNFRLTPSYAVYQSFHTKLTDFNVNDQVGGIEAVYSLSDVVALKGTYAFEYVFVGEHSYDFSHTLGPAVVLNEGSGFSTTVNYSWSKFHFMDSDLFTNNSDRTGFDNLVGIIQKVPLGSAVELRAGYTYDRDFTRDDFWAYSGNRGFAGLAIKFLQSLSMDIYGEYYDKGYKGVDPAIFASARHDRVQTYSIALTQKLTKTLSVVVGQMYIRNKSNIIEFDYKRAITSIFLTARF